MSRLIEIPAPRLCAEITLQPWRAARCRARSSSRDSAAFEGLVRCEIRRAWPGRLRPDRAARRTWSAAESFDKAAWVAPLLEAIGLVRAASPVPLIGFAGAPFTLASYLIEGRPTRTFEKIKAFMHAEPHAWSALMDRLADATATYLTAQVEAGAQALQVFDSWVGALSPGDYRARVQPHMRRLFAALPGDIPVSTRPGRRV